ncbi:MAG: glycine cleavage system aminomethyltransferase GcvT [Candidatus Margulisbacteria bacterium]|nr:glycine cleavage system aminomethyltransferase GcvT [Candidatus Margulisiibacteriota bacterium]
MTLKRTPLFEEHKKLSAKLVEFGGWEMPVLYTNLIEEHLAVRNNVGMFDAGHMGVVKIPITKSQILIFENLLTRKIIDMTDGQIRYNRLVNDKKGIVDDILVYREKDKYFAVFNASNTEKDMSFLKSKEIETQLMGLHIIAVQGPMAEKIIQKHTDLDLSQIKYYHFKRGKFAGVDVIFSRTGYTGEKGFEIMSLAQDNPKIWQILLKDQVPPCGLGARDTLRIEAGMPLYGHELKDNWTNEKSNQILGIKMLEKAIPRQGYKIFDTDQKTEIGEVTSGTFSPSLQEPIALAWIKDKKLDDEVLIQIRNKMYKGKIVKPVFINNTRK